MSAPEIVWLRPGVGYVADAAASMRRLEADLGRPHDCNSSYRDYNVQLSMWRAWQAYVAGTGPYPGHSRALHPDESKHCQGLADDSDDWLTPGYIEFAAERGWIRTAASDPTERHHFEYQWWRDQHRNRPAGAESGEFDTMATKDEIKDAVYEVLVGTGLGPGKRNHWDSLKFIADLAAAAHPSKVWAYLVQAQDENGHPVFKDGKPVMFAARGYLASTSARVGGPVAAADVDEEQLAAALAPLITAQVGSLSDEDIARLAQAAADEQDRRARERLT